MASKYLKLAGVGASVAACAAVGATVSSAATHVHAVTSGTVHVYVTQPTVGKPHDLILGAIDDYGTDATDKTNPNYQQIKLSKGSFEIDAKKLNNGFKPVPVGPGCAQAGISHATVKVLNGTGAYTNITGTLTLTATYAAVGQIVNGKCDVTNKVLAGSFTVEGSGHVSY